MQRVVRLVLVFVFLDSVSHCALLRMVNVDGRQGDDGNLDSILGLKKEGNV